MAVGLFAVSVAIPASQPAQAAAGINQQINYQGRLLNAAGAVIADGSYNMEFKLYKNGDGLAATDNTCTIADCASTTGTLLWTEDWYNTASHGVTVKNGYFSVNLGSITSLASVDFNQSVMWLSMNVGGTTPTAPTLDGEMLPMKRASSSVYAINSGSLGGLSSSQFVQLAQGIQTASVTSNPAIGVNATSGSSNLITLQSSGTDVFDVSSTGNLQFGNNADKTISVATATSGNNGNNLTVQGGSGNGTNKNGGNLVLQGGNSTGSGTPGGVIVRSQTNAVAALAVQNSSSANIFTVDTTNSRVGIGLGVAAPAYALDIAIASGNNGIRVVSSNGATDLLNIAGAGNSFAYFDVDNNGHLTIIPRTDGTGVLSVKESTNTFTVLSVDTNWRRIGINTPTPGAALELNPSGPTEIVLAVNGKSGQSANYFQVYTYGGARLLTLDSNGALVAQNSTDTGAGFQVQNAAGNQLLTVDTSGSQTTLGKASSISGKLTFANSGGTNTVSVAAPTSNPTSSYTLNLPVAVPTTSQCLQSGASTATQLIFGACGTVSPTLQNTYDNSSTPASILLANAKNFVITAADTATDPNILFNLQCVTSCSTNGRFAVQNAGTDLFKVNPNGTIVLGTGSNNLTIASSGEPTLNGTAQHTRRITLTAEYAGAVLDAGTGSNNTGTMTSAIDASNRMNYYKWTTTSGTSQSYDVVVQVPIPSDFAGWASGTTTVPGITIWTYSSTTTANTIKADVVDSSGTDAGFGDITPGSTLTWVSGTEYPTAGTYTAGGYMTLRIRMTSPTNGNLRIGNISMDYLSKW